MDVEKILVPQGYPKIRRLPLGNIVPGKEDTFMPMKHVKELLAQAVTVEEKMDGKITTFRADKDRFLVFGEDLKWKHSIYYKVPARYALLDIFDKNRKLFLSYDEKSSIFDSIKRGNVKIEDQNEFNFFKVPLLERGRFELDQLPSKIRISKYAYDPEKKEYTYCEGIVIKPSRSLFLVEFERYVAKLVRKEFTEGITDNYIHRPKIPNEINPTYAASE